MHVMVIGAAGMVGRKLVEAMAADPAAVGAEVDRLTLVDVIEPAVPAAFSGVGTALAADLSEPGEATRLAATRPDLVFHLAAIVSGEAEADFDKGYRVNLDGTRALFEAIAECDGEAARRATADLIDQARLDTEAALGA